MHREHFVEEWKNFLYRYSFSKFIIVVLTVILIFLVMRQQQLVDKQRTIIVPPNFKTRIEVTDDYANPEYVNHWASYLVQLVYNFTPYSVERNFEQFLHYVPSRHIGEMKQALGDKLKRVRAVDISEFFTQEEIIFNSDGVILKGRLMRLAAGREVSNELIHLLFQYKINHGEIEVETLTTISQDKYKRLAAAAPRGNG